MLFALIAPPAREDRIFFALLKNDPAPTLSQGDGFRLAVGRVGVPSVLCSQIVNTLGMLIYYLYSYAHFLVPPVSFAPLFLPLAWAGRAWWIGDETWDGLGMEDSRSVALNIKKMRTGT